MHWAVKSLEESQYRRNHCFKDGPITPEGSPAPSLLNSVASAPPCSLPPSRPGWREQSHVSREGSFSAHCPIAAAARRRLTMRARYSSASPPDRFMVIENRLGDLFYAARNQTTELVDRAPTCVVYPLGNREPEELLEACLHACCRSPVRYPFFLLPLCEATN